MAIFNFGKKNIKKEIEACFEKPETVFHCVNPKTGELGGGVSVIKNDGNFDKLIGYLVDPNNPKYAQFKEAFKEVKDEFFDKFNELIITNTSPTYIRASDRGYLSARKNVIDSIDRRYNGLVTSGLVAAQEEKNRIEEKVKRDAQGAREAAEQEKKEKEAADKGTADTLIATQGNVKFNSLVLLREIVGEDGKSGLLAELESEKQKVTDFITNYGVIYSWLQTHGDSSTCDIEGDLKGKSYGEVKSKYEGEYRKASESAEKMGVKNAKISGHIDEVKRLMRNAQEAIDKINEKDAGEELKKAINKIRTAVSEIEGEVNELVLQIPTLDNLTTLQDKLLIELNNESQIEK